MTYSHSPLFLLMVCWFFAMLTVSPAADDVELTRTGAKILAADQRVNDDSGNALQEYPAIDKVYFGPMMIAWTDYRNGDADIYLQHYNRSGFRFLNRGNVRVNDDAAGARQSYVDVAMSETGHALVVWNDDRNGDLDIYGQRYYANGDRMGGNFRISDPVAGVQYMPVCATSYSGNSIVAWTDERNAGNGDIYMQRFAADGDPIGGNVLVYADTIGAQRGPEISFHPYQGSFIIAWLNRCEGVTHVVAQRFDADGQSLGAPIVVTDTQGSSLTIGRFCVATHTNSTFLFCWQAGSGSISDIYARIYNEDGTPQTPPFRVNDTADPRLHDDPKAAYTYHATRRAWLITYQSRQSGTLDVYSRTFYDDATPVAPAWRVNDEPADQSAPDVVMDQYEEFYVWHDTRNGARDIYLGWNVSSTIGALSSGYGFDRMVPLAWLPPYGFSGTMRYTITRRKEYDDPPVQVAVIDPSTRPFPNLMLDWIDTDVKNEENYYYTISGDAPGYEGTIGFMCRTSAVGYSMKAHWAEQAPEIDGILDKDEWHDAAKMNIALMYSWKPITVYLKNTHSTLYIALNDSNNHRIEAGDRFIINFDDDHNGKWDATAASDEGSFQISQTGATFIAAWGTYPDHLGASAPRAATGVLHAMGTAGGHMQYELAIDLTASPLNAHPGQTIGISFAVDDPGNFCPHIYGYTGSWPRHALWEAAETLGDLILAVPADTLTKSDWPMVNQCKERTSCAEATDLKPPFSDISEYPIVEADMVNLSFADGILYATTSSPGTIYAFRHSDGTKIWQAPIPNCMGDNACTAAVSEELVFFGAQGTQALYGYDRWNGASQWQKRLAFGPTNSPPLLDENRIYLMDDSLYCLIVDDASTRWSQEALFSPASKSHNLVIDQNNIYTYLNAQLRALNKLTGEQIWESDHVPLFMSCDDRNLYILNNTAVYALDKSDGSIRWQHENPATGFNTEFVQGMAIDDHFLCFTVFEDESHHSQLITLHKTTGVYHWHHNFDTTGVYMPTIANDVVYLVRWQFYQFGGADNSLWGFDVPTGNVVFLDDTETYIGQPIVADNTLFAPARGKIKTFRNLALAVTQTESVHPHRFALNQNYPNPFNPLTTIPFSLAEKSRVKITIYDMLGREVAVPADGEYQPGDHRIRYDAGHLPSGVYFYRIQVKGYDLIKKMVLLR
ncbi:PQQ-binding-like beta-propeller repeat protein [candidate division KSB1 bacterium]|nr:PQQ-binding-like beta-propeller repeat protein [candidate division KSB1 bacterium]